MEMYETLSYIIPPLLGGAITIVLLVIAVVWSRRDFTTLLFSGFLICMALRNFLIFGMRMSPDISQALIWERLVVIPAVGAFVFYFHFTAVYTGVKVKKYFLYGAYLFVLMAIALAPTSMVIERIEIIEYGYAAVVSPLGYIWFAAGPLLIFGATYNLIKTYGTSTSSDEKKRLMLLAVAAAFSVFGMLWDGFTTLPPLSVWCNLIFAILCTIAILRYHLLDIQIIVRRGLAYLMVSFFVAIPYVGALMLANVLFDTILESWWLYTISVFLMALLLRPLYGWSQNVIDRLFYGQRFGYLKALDEFSREIYNITDIRETGKRLTELIGRALRSTRTYLLLSSEAGSYTMIASSPESDADFEFADDHFLIRWLREKNQILDFRQDSVELKPAMGDNPLGAGNEFPELIAPIIAREGELIGFLILTKRATGEAYLEEDRQLLTVITNRTAIQLDNARLYIEETQTRMELQRQNDQKTEFLHTIAHELKTPLTSLIAAIELLTDEADISGVRKQRLVNILKNSTESMDRRVSELLVLARMQTGDLELSIQTLDIGAFINDVASQLSILFNQKEQILKLDIENDLPGVFADKDRLEQILFNLTTNAIKYSPAYSEITLRAKSLDGDVVIEVEDSAPLIDTEESSRLFDPYYRGHEIDEKEHLPGLGLGLYLVKRLVELHHGEIWVKSIPGKGNVFAFSLMTGSDAFTDARP